MSQLLEVLEFTFGKLLLFFLVVDINTCINGIQPGFEAIYDLEPLRPLLFSLIQHVLSVTSNWAKIFMFVIRDGFTAILNASVSL